MKTTLIIFLLLTSAFSCFCQSDSSKQYIHFFDLSTYVSFESDSTQVTIGEISVIDSMLNVCMLTRNNSREPSRNGFGSIRYINEYYKQLVPTIDEKGEKVIWVNCLCNIGQYQKKRLLAELNELEVKNEDKHSKRRDKKIKNIKLNLNSIYSWKSGVIHV